MSYKVAATVYMQNQRVDWKQTMINKEWSDMNKKIRIYLGIRCGIDADISQWVGAACDRTSTDSHQVSLHIWRGTGACNSQYINHSLSYTLWPLYQMVGKPDTRSDTSRNCLGCRLGCPICCRLNCRIGCRLSCRLDRRLDCRLGCRSGYCFGCLGCRLCCRLHCRLGCRLDQPSRVYPRVSSRLSPWLSPRVSPQSRLSLSLVAAICRCRSHSCRPPFRHPCGPSSGRNSADDC